MVRLGNIEVSRRLGKRMRHAVSWMHATGRGRSAGSGAPSPRKTIAHVRLSGWMRDGSNDTVGGMRCPRCMGIIGCGKIR